MVLSAHWADDGDPVIGSCDLLLDLVLPIAGLQPERSRLRSELGGRDQGIVGSIGTCFLLDLLAQPLENYCCDYHEPVERLICSSTSKKPIFHFWAGQFLSTPKRQNTRSFSFFLSIFLAFI